MATQAERMAAIHNATNLVRSGVIPSARYTDMRERTVTLEIRTTLTITETRLRDLLRDARDRGVEEAPSSVDEWERTSLPLAIQDLEEAIPLDDWEPFTRGPITLHQVRETELGYSHRLRTSGHDHETFWMEHISSGEGDCSVISSDGELERLRRRVAELEAERRRGGRDVLDMG